MPPWVTFVRSETPEDVAFLSGAALSNLDLVVRNAAVTHALMRERLAMRAGEACAAFSAAKSGGTAQVQRVA